MTLLDLPVDIWASYLVPLVNVSDMARTAGCSRASGGLVHEALAIAPSVVIVAPDDLHACLIWLKNKTNLINQLIIGQNHQTALSTAKRPQFNTCFQEIVLKFSETSLDVTGLYDNKMLLLLHTKLTVLEIEGPSVAPVSIMNNCLGCQNLHSITYVMKWYHQGSNQNWLTKVIRSNPNLKRLHIGQNSFFTTDIFAAIAERKDTLTEVAMWVGESDGPNGNKHDQLRRLLNSCPLLRRLTFGAYREARGYGDGLVGMENKCPHLEQLIFHHMNFSGDSLPDFLVTCPKLRVCHADGGFIESHDLERWHRQDGPKLHDFGPHWAVERLETVVACATLFAEVRTYHMHCSASWKTAAETLACMPHLHTICLYLHPALILPYIPRYCPQLRVLRFMHGEKPRYAGTVGEALVAVLSNLINLEELRWGATCGFGDRGLMALAQHCPNLRVLDCECIDVTDVGLIALVRGCLALKSLRLRRCCELSVTDAFLHAIAQHCPHLEELRLPAWGWETPPFSHPAVTEVLAACTLLRTLYVPRQLQGGEMAYTLMVPCGAPAQSHDQRDLTCETTRDVTKAACDPGPVPCAGGVSVGIT